MKSEVQTICRGCGHEHRATVFDSINVSENPELKGSVLDGSLFAWECPHCGEWNLLRFKTLYHDPQARQLIWVTLGDMELERRAVATYGSLEEMKDYTARFVDDAGSLIEKVKIFDAGLDDVAMEMCKFVTSREMGPADFALKFYRMEGADGDMTFSYPKDGKMEMVQVGFNVYEDCCGILSRNPSIKEKATGFVRIDGRWLSQFFR